jgi:uncharacterized membrane protein
MAFDAMGIHPFLAHFPLALTFISLVCAVAGVWDRKTERRELAVNFAVALLVGSAVFGPSTALSGWFAQARAQEWSTFPNAEPVLDIHRLLGIIFAIAAPIFAGLAALNFHQRAKSGYRVGIFVTTLLLTALALATGYYGSELVFRHGIAVSPAR